MRNEAVEAEAIGAGGFASVAQQAQDYGLLLAVEDSTSLSYSHGVAAELGRTSSKQDAKRNGFLAHLRLLLDAVSENTVGFACKNGSKGTNSASWRSLSCDQETGHSRG